MPMFIYVVGAPVSRSIFSSGFTSIWAFSRKAVVAHGHLFGWSSCLSESMLFLWFQKHVDTPWMGAFIAHLRACGWSACVSETMLCLCVYKHLGSPLEPRMWPPSLPPIALQSAPSLHPSCPQFAPSLPLACPLPPSPTSQTPTWPNVWLKG